MSRRAARRFNVSEGNLKTTIALAVFGVGVLGAATTRTYQQQIEEFRVAGAGEKKKLGLSDVEAGKRYPTPELKLISADDVGLVLKPGASGTLGFAGQVPKGSLITADCEELEVAKTDFTDKGVKVTVRAGEHALPNRCGLRFWAPVTLHSQGLGTVRVAGRYTLQLHLSNGSRATLKFESTDGEALTGTSEWGKETRPLELRRAGDELIATVGLDEAEQAKVDEAKEKMSTDLQNSKERKTLETLVEKMNAECAKLAMDKMAACFERYGAQAKPLSDKLMTDGENAVTALAVHPVACSELGFKVIADGVVGRGAGCKKAGISELKGTITVER